MFKRAVFKRKGQIDGSKHDSRLFLVQLMENWGGSINLRADIKIKWS